ncbi:MAG: undecaprenyl-phosphate glucose phosphotransferase [Steroidobacteraceae bacterium]
MSRPVLLKSSVAVAGIRLLQGLAPAVMLPASLYIIIILHGVPFAPPWQLLAAISGVLSFVALEPKSDDMLDLDMGASVVVAEVALRLALTMGLLYFLGIITGHVSEFPRKVILMWAVISTALTCVCEVSLLALMRWVVMSGQNERSAVIVGVNAGSILLAGRLRQHPEYCTNVKGFFDDRTSERLEATGELPILGNLSELVAYTAREGVEVIFIALPLRHIQRVMQLLDHLRDSTMSIYYVPDVYVFDLIQARSGDIGGVPIIAMCETPFFGFRGVLKRLTDIFFTLCIMLPLLPVMLILALAIRVSSRGPAIFKQRRYGLDGKEIVVYKFRSMYVEEDGPAVAQAQKDDPRITPIGRILRRLSLDELPQLINVLQGRMSLVGPRPHAVAHNEMYRVLIKGYMMRHKVLPGITGLAQVNGCRGETTELEQMQARVNYDLDYLRQWSPLLDLQILVKTAVQMVRGDEKAY